MRKVAMLSALVAVLAATAEAQVGVGKLGACQIYATCPDPFAETCARAIAPLRLFAAPVRTAGSTQRILWIETDYSRFPKSDVNEETGFLPVTILPKDDWQAKIAALTGGTEKVTGTTGLLWARLNDDLQDGAAFDLYQFNAQGAVRRSKFVCPPGEM